MFILQSNLQSLFGGSTLTIALKDAFSESSRRMSRQLQSQLRMFLFRLNTLERASFYEQTWSENWLDELDGEESFGESLDMDPPSSRGTKLSREKKGTESDVAVSD